MNVQSACQLVKMNAMQLLPETLNWAYNQICSPYNGAGNEH